MPHAEHSVLIERPPSEVFAVLADGEQCTRWRSGVIEIKKISGQGVGATYKQAVRGPGGRSVAADYRITECEPNRVLAFEAIAGPVRPRGRYNLEDQGHATQVTFTLDAELGGLKGLLMGSMVNKTMQSEVRALDRLKAVLEEEPAAEKVT